VARAASPMAGAMVGEVAAAGSSAFYCYIFHLSMVGVNIPTKFFKFKCFANKF
jgi:hypothetical protein